MVVVVVIITISLYQDTIATLLTGKWKNGEKKMNSDYRPEIAEVFSFTLDFAVRVWQGFVEQVLKNIGG